MRFLMACLIFSCGCVAKPPTDERAAGCVAMTFAYRNITRDVRGSVRITLDDQTDDYRDLGVYEVGTNGLRPLGLFRIWNNRRMEFSEAPSGQWEAVGVCD